MLRRGTYPRTRIMIAVSYFLGFRIFQISRVRGDDIGLLTKMLRSLSKGNKERRVPLHLAIEALAPTMPAEWWFLARDGSDRPIRPPSVTDLITKAKKHVGTIDIKLTPHSLHHDFATDLVDVSVDTRVIQEFFFHDDLSSTQIYADVSDKRKKEAIQKLPIFEVPVRAIAQSAV